MVVWVVDGESVVYVGWREVVLAWALISVISHALLSSSSPCPRCAMSDVLYGVAIPDADWCLQFDAVLDSRLLAWA